MIEVKVLEAIAGAVDGLAESLRAIVASPAIRQLCRACEKVEQTYMIENSHCSGRVKHLARHAKKRRVRKKNMDKIRREYKRKPSA